MATLKELKEKFNKALLHINRNGMDNLIHWLENETDFFEGAASTKFHGNFEGGLLCHSLYVLEFALTNFNWIIKYKPEYEYMKESVIFCSLFHDVSKTNLYVKEEKWTKDSSNKWVKYMGYSVDDKFPYPHGPKSVFLISKFVELKDIEALAIAYHMGTSDPGVVIDGLGKYAYNNASEHPLVKIIMGADLLATTIEETIDYKSQVIS